MRGGRLVFGLVLATLVTACAPEQLEQPQSGDGWRLIGWTRGGEQRAPAVGEDAIELLGDLGLRRMGAAVPGADPATEVDVVVTHAVSGSCPQVRFDGFDFDAANGRVEARITDREDLLSLEGSCSADAKPVVFWLAVDRSRLPGGPFEMATDEAPDVRTDVDLGA